MIYKKGTAFSIVLVFTALSFLGWFFIPYLSLSLQAEKKQNNIAVTTYWAHSSPRQVEKELTSKLESAVNKIQGVNKISSVSKKGISEINIEINEYEDIDKFRLNLSSEIRRIFPLLPKGTSYPKISFRSTNHEDKPLIIYSLRAADNTYILQEYAENNIKPALSLIGDIDKTEVYGGTNFEYLIKYNSQVINELHISPNEIKEAINRSFEIRNLGNVIEYNTNTNDNNLITVRLSSLLSLSDDLKNIPIKKISNKIVYLRDIATISKAQQQPNAYYRINGENAINIVVYAKKNSNAINLTSQTEETINIITKNLPSGYTLEKAYKSTEYIEKELNKIYKRTFLTLLILLLFVAIVSRNIKYILIISLSLITNISLAFVVYYFLKVQIHLYSLAGITVSLGLIIDNAIVMTDHLLYRKNLNIYTALLASTLTTAASLTVIWLLPDELKLNLRDFSLIIIINLAVSLLVSLFYTPALYSLFNHTKTVTKNFIKRKKIIISLNKIYFYLLSFLIRFRKTTIIIFILFFGIPVFLLPPSIEKQGIFADIYNKTFGSEWYKDNLKSPLEKYLGGSLRLFSYYVYETSYYSKPEDTKLYVFASLPKGSTLTQLNDIIKSMESYLSQYKGNITFFSKINNPQFAQITIRFKDDTSPMLPYLLKSKLVSYGLTLGGVNWNIYGVGKGFSQSAGLNEDINFKVALTGYNLLRLEEYTQMLKHELEKHPRVSQINTSANKQWWYNEKSFEYQAIINSSNLDFYGWSVSEIIKSLSQKTINYYNFFDVVANNKRERIHLIPHVLNNVDKWNILNLPGETGKLLHYINIFKVNEEEQIFKENQSYIKLVDFKYIGSRKFGNEYLQEVLEKINELLPPGYHIKSLSMSWNKNKEPVMYSLAILLILIMIFFICSILFESLKWPFAIIIMIPFSFIGIFFIFYYFDFNFDQGGYASFVLVSGLVVNASIYLLNEYSALQKQNSSKQSISLFIKAFNRKIIPILLTILSTVLGLIPFIMTGQNEAFWFALAIGTIGGLLFSLIILTLIFPLFIIKKPLITK